MKEIEWENMSNNDIMAHLMAIKMEHENQKQVIVREIDRLDKMRDDYNEGNKILRDRLKR